MKRWNIYTICICVSNEIDGIYLFFCLLCHIVQHIKLVKAWSINIHLMYARIFIYSYFFLPSNLTMTLTLFLLLFLDNWWCGTTRCTTQSGTTWSHTWSTPSSGSDSPPVYVHSTRYRHCKPTFICEQENFAILARVSLLQKFIVTNQYFLYGHNNNTKFIHKN